MTDRDICKAVLGRLTAAALSLAVIASAAGARAAGDPASGARLAQAYCGECHALGAGKSPLPDAPPFATLHRRYPAGGGLDDLLSEGMIAPAQPLDESRRPFHPRMPQVTLDDGQLADLAAFLRSAQIQDRGRP
jgi:mono/diheme cytochrome c family protein